MTDQNKKSIFRKDIIGWSLYDFANTIYSMNIVSLYLKRYIVVDLGQEHAWFDIPFSISMILAAIFLPALGAMSDHSTKKKVFLFLFTVTSVIAVGGMAFVPQSALILLILLFIVSNFAYEAGQPFYNSLLYSVSSGREARFVSGIGVALGYVGSVVGMIIVLPFVTGDLFGLTIPFITGWGKVGSFLPTAFLFMLFSLPLLLWVKEKPVKVESKTSIKQSYKEVWEGIRETKKYPGVLRFLIADYFFEDAAMTVILNIGIYCQIVIGFSEGMITTFLIVSTLSAVIGSLVIGKVAQIWSLKKMVAAVVVGWIVSLVMFVLAENLVLIWILGSLVGILLGGLWTTTRPLLAELVPEKELGRFFGIFSLSGRAAAAIGPLIWTAILYIAGPEKSVGKMLTETFNLNSAEAVALPFKIGIIALALMMAIGLYIFRKVPSTRQVENG